MRALVIYESMFGNTRDVAEAIAAGLAEHASVSVLEVSTAPTSIEDIDLLVVGAPTHAFGLSRESTRASAAKETSDALISGGRGLREWLAEATIASGIPAAAFDTHATKPNLPGSAASVARRRLRRVGVRVLVPPESFHIEGMTGPLGDGELARARDWGRRLAASVAGAPA